MPDATAELMSRLDDPTQWVIVRGVPVCRPHVRAEKGKTRIAVGAKDLATIAKNTQQAEDESATPVRLTVGHVHTRDESDQPTLIGFARNWRVGAFGPKNVPCVMCDYYVDPRHQDALKQYPYRSMELDPADQRIRGVAVLLRDPWLDLGAVYYHSDGWLIHYEGSMDDFTEDEVKTYDRMCKYMMKRYAKLAPYMTDGKDDAGMAQQAEGGSEAGAGKDDGDGTAKHARGIEERLARMEALNREAGQALASEKAARLLDRVRDSVKFDYQRELRFLMVLPADQQEKHIVYMLDNYQHLPGRDRLPVYSGPAYPSGSAASAAASDEVSHERVMSYMRAHPGMSYEQAERSVASQK